MKNKKAGSFVKEELVYSNGIIDFKIIEYFKYEIVFSEDNKNNDLKIVALLKENGIELSKGEIVNIIDNYCKFVFNDFEYEEKVTKIDKVVLASSSNVFRIFYNDNNRICIIRGRVELENINGWNSKTIYSLNIEEEWLKKQKEDASIFGYNYMKDINSSNYNLSVEEYYKKYEMACNYYLNMKIEEYKETISNSEKIVKRIKDRFKKM